MDAVRNTIVARVAELGLSLSELSLKVGKNHAYFQQFIKSQVPIRGATGWIPVYGHAVGGKDGEFVLSGNQVSEVLAPPSLLHVRDAYAVYVVGDTMEPRYFAGETVFVNPRLPISRGSFVVAQISKGEEPEPRAYVKRFLSQDGKRLRLEQYNPKKVLEFPASTVVAIHRIVMSSENR